MIFLHADDAAAFCGGTLAKFARQGWKVILARVTDDHKDSVGLKIEETLVRSAPRTSSVPMFVTAGRVWLIWGMQDVALSHHMARPSMEYCEDGKLVLFEDTTHRVQHDEAEAVNHLLIEFLSR